MVAADVSMLLGELGLFWLVLGRVLSGVAVGLGTGSAAALVLMALGERGRTIVASGSVSGSLLGNLGSSVLATYLPNSTAVAYLGHGLVTLALSVALLMLWARRQNAVGRDLDPVVAKTTERATRGPIYEARHRVAGYLLGGLAWTIAGVVLALIPASIRLIDPGAAILTAIAPACALLTLGSVAQFVVARRILRLRAWQVLIPLVVGTGLAAVSLEERSYVGLVIACAVIGMGQGPGYTLGLATVTHGLLPRFQGKAASTYALAAYGLCAAAVVAIGAASSAWGLASALYLTTVAFAGVSAIVVSAAGRPQQWKSVTI